MKPGDQAEMLKKVKGTLWADGMGSFLKMLEAWRADGKLEGMEVEVV
jgi:hypothetical protein